MAKTARSSPGLISASYAAEARPLTNSTQEATAAKPSVATATSTGLNRGTNGAVTFRVISGLDTTNRGLRASSGFDLFTVGCVPSRRRTRPSGRSFCSTSSSTSSASSCRPETSLTLAAS